MTLTMDFNAAYDTTPNADEDGAPTNTTVTVATDNGLLDDTSIAYLVALSTLTGKSTKVLGHQAIDALRHSLVPTTTNGAKPAAATPTSTPVAGRGGRRKNAEVTA